MFEVDESSAVWPIARAGGDIVPKDQEVVARATHMLVTIRGVPDGCVLCTLWAFNNIHLVDTLEGYTLDVAGVLNNDKLFILHISLSFELV